MAIIYDLNGETNLYYRDRDNLGRNPERFLTIGLSDFQIPSGSPVLPQSFNRTMFSISPSHKHTLYFEVYLLPWSVSWYDLTVWWNVDKMIKKYNVSFRGTSERICSPQQMSFNGPSKDPAYNDYMGQNLNIGTQRGRQVMLLSYAGVKNKTVSIHLRIMEHKTLLSKDTKRWGLNFPVKLWSKIENDLSYVRFTRHRSHLYYNPQGSIQNVSALYHCKDPLQPCPLQAAWITNAYVGHRGVPSKSQYCELRSAHQLDHQYAYCLEFNWQHAKYPDDENIKYLFFRRTWNYPKYQFMLQAPDAELKTWVEADSLCRSVWGYLPMFYSKNELQDLLDFIKLSKETTPLEAIYIGLVSGNSQTAHQDISKFYWHDQNPVSYQAWGNNYYKQETKQNYTTITYFDKNCVPFEGCTAVGGVKMKYQSYQDTPDISNIKLQLKNILMPVLCSNMSCTMMLMGNLGEPQWINVNCFERTTGDIFCFSEKAKNISEVYEMDRLFHGCSNDQILNNSTCFSLNLMQV